MSVKRYHRSTAPKPIKIYLKRERNDKGKKIENCLLEFALKKLVKELKTDSRFLDFKVVGENKLKKDAALLRTLNIHGNCIITVNYQVVFVTAGQCFRSDWKELGTET